MFACIHSRSVSNENATGPALVELAFTFSPLVEQTSADTVVFDVTGQDLLFGQVTNTHEPRDLLSRLAEAITQRAHEAQLQANVSIAANPDAAIHAARSLPTLTIINRGEELHYLGMLSIKQLDCSLANVELHKAEEIYATFVLWGVRTFRDLAGLPLTGVAERLGQEGVRLQRLAQGGIDRALHLVRPPIGFEQSLALEHPITEIEPLSFILSRLLNQLCANLSEYGLATNELHLQLVSEPGAVATGSCESSESIDPVATALGSDTERVITLPVPMRNPKILLRLLLFDIEREPPQAPIVAVTISADPVKPRAGQTGLFTPLAPEPEKLEITLARLAKLVGPRNVGSPEPLDTHRPDAFRMKRFNLATRKKSHSNPQSTTRNPQCVSAFRIFRPAWPASVQTTGGQPRRLETRAQSLRKLSGKILRAAGPWRGSGDWWRPDVWARDEWDVSLIDASSGDEVLCRIYRDLTNEEWFVAGIYD